MKAVAYLNICMHKMKQLYQGRWRFWQDNPEHITPPHPHLTFACLPIKSLSQKITDVNKLRDTESLSMKDQVILDFEPPHICCWLCAHMMQLLQISSHSSLFLRLYSHIYQKLEVWLLLNGLKF